ncbi:hypothetical protein Tco_1183144 [Tanacetum coccineum]
MTGDRSRLRNFVKKFIGTVRFRNDHFGAIMGYGDYVIGESVISRVYYVEGLGHNLFSIGQFCNSNLEVAFKKHSFYVRDTDGVELIKDLLVALCYPTNDSEDLGKLQPTTDIGIFVGYAPSMKGLVSPTPAVSVSVNSADTPSSTTIDQDAPSPSHSPSSSILQSPSLHKGIAADSYYQKTIPIATFGQSSLHKRILLRNLDLNASSVPRIFDQQKHPYVF